MRLSGIETGLCDHSDLFEEFLDCDSAHKGSVEPVDAEQDFFDVSIYITNPDSAMDEAQKLKLGGDTLEGGSGNVVCLASGEMSRGKCGASEVCLFDRHTESEELYSDKKSMLADYEMPSYISRSTDLWSDCFETSEQKSAKIEDADSRSPIKYVEDDNDSAASFDDFLRKSILKDFEEKEGVNICSRVLPSQSTKVSVEVLHQTSDFPLNYGECAEQDDKISMGASSVERISEVVLEKSEIDSVNGGYATRVMEMSEEKEDVQIVEMVETYINESPVKDNSGKFNEGLSNDAGNSTTPHAIPSYDIAQNGPFNKLGVSNCYVTGNVVTQSNSSITKNSLDLMDNEERGKIHFDSLLISKTSEYMCQSSQRSMDRNKSSRKTQKPRAANKCRSPSNRALDSDKSTEILSEPSRRKRSCISKPARSSAWGYLANISAIFEQNKGFDAHNHLIKHSQKAQHAKGRRRHNKGDGSREGGGSLELKKKHQAGSHIRLKIKIGKQMDQTIIKVMAPEQDGEEIPPMVNSLPDASYLDGNVVDKYLESCIPLCESFLNNSEDIPEISTLVEAKLEAPVEGIENKYLDPGTSPDSEVIYQIPDGCATLRVQEDMHNAHLNSPTDFVVPRDVSGLSLPQMCSTKGTMNGKIHGAGECVVNLKCGLEDDFFSIPNVGFGSLESENVENAILPSKKKGNKSSKSLKTSRVNKSKSEMPDVVGSKGGFVGRQKESRGKSLDKNKVMEKGVSDKVLYKMESHPEIGVHVVNDNEGKNMGDEDALEDKSNLVMVSNGELEPYLPPRNAWVSCDECQKWRRIPATLADSIDETNSKWTCKDNLDKAFADCSKPQEMSNAQINAELDISDEENANCDRYNSKGFERRHSTVAQPSVWTLIKSNLFLHRKRKSQNIDEIMVCNCKSSAHGHSGCGDDCLNRILNIECVKGTCPCGDRCSNQQFQKHNYAKLNSFRCGKKGYGLQILEDISKGQFLIEYVGEVLDLHAYEARQKDYASRGHKHFYFMTLNGSEVIDACAKGNLGRFINHSCDPNCRTEKWMVNGEICIGLFAVRNIKKGEELTFDYNYVRVFGAAAKKCVCGSSLCRGYIGGDPLSDEVIIQGDSDEEFPEPVMVPEDGETAPRLDNILPKFNAYNNGEIQKVAVEGRNSIEEYGSSVAQVITENEESTEISARDVPQSPSCSEMDASIGKLPSSVEPADLRTKDMISKPLLIAQQDITTIQESVNKSPSHVIKLEKLIAHTYDANKNPPLVKVEDDRISLKSQLSLKPSHTSSSVKRRKHKSKPASTNKSKLMPSKPKKVLQGSANSRYEAIEEKLNELLDADGGISKRNDASKGYLKLLLLTAASGDSGTGEAIQSNRDLSMILEALLKTRSRIVLVDIINKNGLRMLHNIMKQSRKEYNKTPILRKLLKVLEYLAAKQILTLEHINGGPPCPGMESFRDSILRLTEHNNKQVYQIARNFRDRWMPRPSRNTNCMERDDGRADFHKGSNCNRFSVSNNYRQDHQAARATESTIDCTKQEECSSSSGAHCSTNGTKTRKRKSRWDEPAETNLSIKEQKIHASPLHNLDSISQMPELVQNHTDMVNEDVPPGFSCPMNVDIPGESDGHSKSFFEKMALGIPQERYISALPVSYGIPMSMLQQIGISEAETVDSWKIAPGIIFHPFPPLPPYPPNRKNLSPSVSAPHHMNQSSPSTSGVAVTDVNVSGTNNHHTFHQPRGYPNDLGKRFKQQKWNNNKLTPPWLRKRNNGWRQNGNNPFNQN